MYIQLLDLVGSCQHLKIGGKAIHLNISKIVLRVSTYQKWAQHTINVYMYLCHTFIMEEVVDKACRYVHMYMSISVSKYASGLIYYYPAVWYTFTF